MNFIKQHWILTSLVLVALTATAAKIGDDLLTVGKPGSTADKQLVFNVGDGAANPAITIDYTDKVFDLNKAARLAGDYLQVGDGTNTNKEVIFNIGSGANNPRFRWNSVNNVLEFALDGTTFRAIGSGSGGASGVNLLAEANFNFELGSPPDDWTASGGTFTAESAEPIFGDQSGAWDSNASAQTLCSQAVQIERGFLGRTCQAEIEYRYDVGTAADYKLSAVDTGSEVAFIDLAVTPTGEARKAQLVFDCPDLNTDTLQLCLESQVADADPVEVDEAFIGTGRNTFEISQAEIYAEVEVTGCLASTTSGTFVEAVGTTTCSYEVFGKAVDPGNDKFELLIDRLVPGQYKIDFNGTLRSNTSGAGNQGCWFRFSTNDSTAGNVRAVQDLNQGKQEIAYMTDTYTTTVTETNKSFIIEFARQSGTGACEVGTSGYNRFTLIRYPLNSAEAITLETSGFWVQAATNFPADIPLGGASSAFEPINDASGSLDPKNGSFPVGISCDGVNAIVGSTTCSGGDENAGITFDAPTAGRYQVCVSFNHTIRNNGTGDNNIVVFRLDEYNLDSTSVLQSGQVHRDSRMTNHNAAIDIEKNTSINFCENFVFSSPGQKVVNLIYAQSIGGTPVFNNLQTANDRRPVFTVEKMDQQFPTPIFTDLRETLATKVETQGASLVAYSARIINTPGPLIDEEYGNWIDSITDNGTGSLTLNLTPGVFNVSNRPHCTLTPRQAGRANPSIGSNATQVSTITRTLAGANEDQDFHIICIGIKP